VTHIFCYSDSSFLLQCLSHFLDFVTRYSNSAIFSVMTQSLFRFRQLFFRFHRALQWLGHFLLQCSIIFRFLSVIFWDFITRYSDSAIFCCIDSFIFWILSAIFEISSTRYGGSTILLQWLSHFLFCQLFLRFRHALQWLNHLFYRESSIFWFCYTVLEWLNYFMICQTFIIYD
jgi:hypothetical protein